jgi:hypothetical protein
LPNVVCAAFFSFVIGGWVAGTITGARHSEPAIRERHNPMFLILLWLLGGPLTVLIILYLVGVGH